MDTDALAGLMVIVLYLLILIVPAAKILTRVGFGGWWSILAVVPLAGLIGVWVFAFVRWPIDNKLRA
jgi:hypothetical protein